MAVGKELFKLWGVIGMQGVEATKSELLKIDRQSRKVQKEMDRMGRKVTDVGKVLTKALTVPLIAAAAATVKFIDDAADLNETVSKTEAIFGDSADAILKWSDSSAKALGQTKQEALDAATTFAIFGQKAGLSGKELQGFSTEFVELASDMASFFNTEPEEAITAIGAAFRGETEPIRRYGVMLDDATMRQKAFELGLVSSTKNALMPQTKILAAQALIMEQTTQAQGDFARTAGGLANQKRILTARVKDTSAALGQLFLPVALKAVDMAGDLLESVQGLIKWWKGLSEQTKTTIKGFVLLAAAIGPVTIVIGKIIVFSKVLIPLLVALKTGTFGWAAAMGVLQKSVLGVTLVVGALAALAWYFYSQWETVSVQLKIIWARMRLFIAKGVNSIAQTVADGMLKIVESVESVGSAIPGLGKKFKDAKISILQFKAALFRDIAKQTQYVGTIRDQAEANVTLSDSLKKAVADGKAALGIKKETTVQTQKQIDAEKAAAKAAAKIAEDRKQFDADILEQTRRVGADKMTLLSLEREKAVEEAERLGADVQAVRELYAAKERELLAEQEQARVDFNDRTREQINELSLTKLELLEIEKQEMLRQAEELGAGKDEINTLFALKEAELKDRLRREEKRKDKQLLRERLGEVTRFGNQLNGILNKFADNRLKRLELDEKRQIEAVKNSQMTEEQKQAAIQKIEEETEKKRQAMERQRAIREKVAALFNIALNTATAVIEALPNIPLSIVIGAMGLAAAAAVIAQPLPFQEGGLVRGSEEGINAQIGERGQDELVMPLATGVNLFVDSILNRLNEIEFPTFGGPSPVLAAEVPSRTVNLNIGTLVADNRGLKELERRLTTIRISEDQRKGFS